MVRITRNAAEAFIQRAQGKKYVRILVNQNKGKDCSFSVEFSDSSQRNDILFINHGIRILMDKSHHRYFDDLEIDYNNGKINEFSFNSSEGIV